MPSHSAMVYPTELTRQPGFNNRFHVYNLNMPYGEFCSLPMVWDPAGYLLFASAEKRVIIDTYMEEGAILQPHTIIMELTRRWRALNQSDRALWLVQAKTAQFPVMGVDFENSGVRLEAALTNQY